MRILTMYVKEFGQQLTSKELNGQLKAVYNWGLNLNEMSDAHANGILNSMQAKLRRIKESRTGHFAEKNPQYMEALLVTRVLESLIGEREESYIMERKLKKAEMNKREKYVKGMKKVKGDFEKRYPGRGEDVMYATASKMAKKQSVEEAMSVLRSVLAGNMTLLEGEFDQAAAIVAARDMVDTMQDFVEKIGKMVNEDLPALVDVMRGDVGADQAEAFNQAALAALNPLMDQVRGARQSLDGAARAAAGDSSAMPSQPMMGGDAGAAPSGPAAGAGTGLSAPPPMNDDEDMEEPEATADAATGGKKSLGREKRI
jgi:hypothetical protein